MTEIGGCAAQSDGDVRAALRRASRCLRHRTYAAAVPPIGHAGAPETAETTTPSGSPLTRTASSREAARTAAERPLPSGEPCGEAGRR